MITNEMIKASLPMILPVYHKLFNTILSLGTVPNICCNGIITPIFKSGARNDSSNYRGICVSSCFNVKPKTTWTCRSGVDSSVDFKKRLEAIGWNSRYKKKNTRLFRMQSSTILQSLSSNR